MTERAPEPAPLPSLDGLFRRTLAQAPDRLALCDPPDKPRITGSPPRKLTYAEADRAIGALAAHFAEARLPAGSVVALQLPNTVEAALTVLAAARAGLIAAPLPQLWRQADLAAALNRISARAIVAFGVIDGVNHAELAMNAAAETFSIRHVCGFGADLPDGMVPIDEMPAPGAAPDSIEDARRPAIVTFDMTADGIRAVPRSHAAMIAGGLAVYLEGRLPQQASIAAAVTPSSFGTLAASLMAWLLTGGTLVLHHPFAPQLLLRQIEETPCDVLVAPAALALKLSACAPVLRHVVGLWRSPEQIAGSAPWDGDASFTDVALFGEIGLSVARRGDGGLPAPFAAAEGEAAPETPGVSDDLRLTAHGTLAICGPMVPLAAYQAGALPDDVATAEIDTGYAARRAPGGVIVTAPPAGVLGVGGYRFRGGELEAWSRMLPPDTTLAAVPDRLLGHRLAGHAADRARTREALIALGLNPLVAEAFRGRSNPPKNEPNSLTPN